MYMKCVRIINPTTMINGDTADGEETLATIARLLIEQAEEAEPEQKSEDAA